VNRLTPLYRQIASRIKEDIILSNLGKDEAILPENKLAEKYKVSRVTIRRAIDLLVKEGILYRIQGSGTYVKTEKINHDIYKLQGFTEEMLQLQQNPINKILEFRLEYPDRQVRDILHLKEDERVFFVRRLRCVGEEPMILEETYLPEKLFPDLSVEVMSKSKYDYVERKGYQIKERRGEISAIFPNKSLNQLLRTPKDLPLIYMSAWAYLEDGTVFEYTKLYFRSDKYTFKFSSKRM